ncbi:MAG: SRPBCC family protein [Pseudomonadales bacterium]|nr:SRPBCC family protein [Pseudomonadales bacterium]
MNGKILGTITRSEGYFEARLERFLPHTQLSVWAMLTQSEKLSEWLAPGDIELRQGGSVNLNFSDSGTIIDSKISKLKVPSLLEYSWSGPGDALRPVCWEISTTAKGCLLSISLVESEQDITKSCAGWEAHFMMLDAALEGSPIPFPFEHFQATRAQYNQLID